MLAEAKYSWVKSGISLATLQGILPSILSALVVARARTREALEALDPDQSHAAARAVLVSVNL